jgi:signal transduction histidine kinase
MPFIDQVVPDHRAPVIVAGLLAMAVCLCAAWLRTALPPAAKSQRGRLRELGWCAVLAVVAVLLAASIYSLFLDVMVLGLAALVVLLRPRSAALFAAGLLVIFGFCGIADARTLELGLAGSGWYGVAPARPGSVSLELAQAYVLLGLGGWLGWCELRSRPAAARLVLGRTAALPAGDQLWVLVLLPVAVLASALIHSNAWLPVMVVLVTVCLLVLRRAPLVAARAAALTLIGLGLGGLLLVKASTPAGFVPQSLYVVPGSGATVLAGTYQRFGLVEMNGQGMIDVALAEAFVFLGLGCWLVPRSFPAARRVMGLVTQAQHTTEVRHLTESRAVVADAAAADVRRLERDLHDGAQARLVALGMNLRAAERLILTSPEAAAALVAEARESSARALTELRELVRGVHPPVLADRGLADAVVALALDSPLAVQTDLDLPGRVPAPVETACYFAVAELLTNAAKHSGARDARITICHSGGMLRVEVTDFGLGGADPARGSGLAGVEKRLATFDGILAISSPPGGPTIVVMEVPCALSSPRISSF